MRKLRAIYFSAALFVPALANACPRCFEAADTKVLNAYFTSLGMLSFLPLSIIAGVVVWVVTTRRKSSNEAD